MSMATLRFKRALRIIEKWPVDPSKAEHRDIGVFLRKRIQSEFRQGEHTELENPELCDKMLRSLENIVNNKYKLRYATEKSRGAFGLSYEISKDVISEAGLAAVRAEAEIGIVKRTFHQISDGRFKKESEQLKIEGKKGDDVNN